METEQNTMEGLPSSGAPRRDWRRVSTLAARAVALVWRAARGMVLVLAAVQVITGAAAAVQVLLVGKVLLVLVAPRSGVLSQLVPYLAAYLLVYVVERVAGAVRAEATTVLTELTGTYARRRLLEQAGQVDLISYEEPAFHDRLKRASESANMRTLEIVQGLASLSGSLMKILGVTVALVVIQPLLLPMAALLVPMWKIMKKNSNDTYLFFFGTTRLERERDYIYWLATDRHPAKEVRAFGLTGYLGRRFDALSGERIAQLRAVAWRRLRRQLGATALGALLIAATLALIAGLYSAGRADLQATGASGAAYLKFLAAVTELMMGITALYESSLFLDDFDAFVRPAAPAVAVPPARPALDTLAGIEAVDVSFTYPGATSRSLTGVNVRLARGEVVALVGANGSGKTTLAKILAGLYAADSGRVLWNGTPVDDQGRVAMRDQTALVFQDFLHYDFSMRENVGLGQHEHIDDEPRMRAAVAAAGADDIVSRLDSGLDTRLGRLFEGGQDLSIGQWQRVALARAFFRDAGLVVLDEPTAALDARAEQQLFDHMRDLCAGRAVLLISHRFGTARLADRIYVLQNGRIVECGDHDSLVAAKGLYHEMYTLQANAFRTASDGAAAHPEAALTTGG